jgi:hypothetical protein
MAIVDDYASIAAGLRRLRAEREHRHQDADEAGRPANQQPNNLLLELLGRHGINKRRYQRPLWVRTASSLPGQNLGRG